MVTANISIRAKDVENVHQKEKKKDVLESLSICPMSVVIVLLTQNIGQCGA